MHHKSGKGSFLVQTGDGVLELLEVQLEGKTYDHGCIFKWLYGGRGNLFYTWLMNGGNLICLITIMVLIRLMFGSDRRSDLPDRICKSKEYFQ